MTLARDLVWTNVRPIGADEEARVLRRFNAIEQCFGAPAWAEFAGEPEDVKAVTITCGRTFLFHRAGPFVMLAKCNGAADEKKQKTTCFH